MNPLDLVRKIEAFVAAVPPDALLRDPLVEVRLTGRWRLFFFEADTVAGKSYIFQEVGIDDGLPGIVPSSTTTTAQFLLWLNGWTSDHHGLACANFVRALDHVSADQVAAALAELATLIHGQLLVRAGMMAERLQVVHAGAQALTPFCTAPQRGPSLDMPMGRLIKAH